MKSVKQEILLTGQILSWNKSRSYFRFVSFLLSAPWINILYYYYYTYLLTLKHCTLLSCFAVFGVYAQWTRGVEKHASLRFLEQLMEYFQQTILKYSYQSWMGPIPQWKPNHPLTAWLWQCPTCCSHPRGFCGSHSHCSHGCNDSGV